MSLESSKRQRNPSSTGIVVRLNTHSPSQSAPTILKNRAPCFLKKTDCKKTKVIVIQKEKRQPGLFSFWIKNDPVFLAYFLQKAGCPILKNSGCRLTGQMRSTSQGSKYPGRVKSAVVKMRKNSVRSGCVYIDLRYVHEWMKKWNKRNIDSQKLVFEWRKRVRMV